MTGSNRAPILLAGIGNPDRGDDGFGPAVANRLRGSLPDGVRILERNSDVLALIDEWNGCFAVVLVDAAAPVSRPGRIHRLDLTSQPLSVGLERSSTHAFGIAEAVELARNLDRLPPHLIAYLVEGERFEIGAALSQRVAETVDRVAERILREISLLSAACRAAGAAEHA
ncbi:MAG TPA: hydrogenase maturation protease [Stellaceae bacterium]|nr:hydrogenase maturation protease [Stellaceae bacterium]